MEALTEGLNCCGNCNNSYARAKIACDILYAKDLRRKIIVPITIIHYLKQSELF